MTKEQKHDERQRHLAAALYMDTPMFSKIKRNKPPTNSVQVVC